VFFGDRVACVNLERYPLDYQLDEDSEDEDVADLKGKTHITFSGDNSKILSLAAVADETY